MDSKTGKEHTFCCTTMPFSSNMFLVTDMPAPTGAFHIDGTQSHATPSTNKTTIPGDLLTAPKPWSSNNEYQA
jgi:hypothetical protein